MHDSASINIVKVHSAAHTYPIPTHTQSKRKYWKMSHIFNPQPHAHGVYVVQWSEPRSQILSIFVEIYCNVTCHDRWSYADVHVKVFVWAWTSWLCSSKVHIFMRYKPFKSEALHSICIQPNLISLGATCNVGSVSAYKGRELGRW